ncbi:hypothetical protein K458DRAFT_407213 [Lentithecium fluviatile CBS 122367]|uniref:Uncharacterized protein n=1 Tax=Lentithecium fluviatile CBS 122367 TaxID=1168545 RepID=A0A6G1IR55_9PLEO|nr:hypothetical protein K458DRAFT_407213 [Lentithecium fluviatile CBS 122367]
MPQSQAHLLLQPPPILLILNNIIPNLKQLRPLNPLPLCLLPLLCPIPNLISTQYSPVHPFANYNTSVQSAVPLPTSIQPVHKIQETHTNQTQTKSPQTSTFQRSLRLSIGVTPHSSCICASAHNARLNRGRAAMQKCFGSSPSSRYARSWTPYVNWEQKICMGSGIRLGWVGLGWGSWSRCSRCSRSVRGSRCR